MADQEQQKIDTTEVPNFDGLRKWMDKLEAWCKKVVEESESAAMEFEEKTAAMDNEVTQAREDTQRLEFIEEFVADIERGIRTFDELVAELKPVNT